MKSKKASPKKKPGSLKKLTIEDLERLRGGMLAAEGGEVKKIRMPGGDTQEIETYVKDV